MMQRRHFHATSVCLKKPATIQPLPGETADDTIWQHAGDEALTPRALKKIGRVPKRPNKNWTSKDINQARDAIKKARARQTAEKSATRSKATSDHTASSSATRTRGSGPTDFVKLYAESLEHGKLRAWANQGMQDVLSPEAFEDWMKSHRIPRQPNEQWTAKDIRRAATYQKRQRKQMTKLEQIRSKQANTVTVFRDLNLRPTANKTQKSSPKRKKAEAEEVPPAITALKQQAQDRARTRILREAFRGLLSPAKQRRSIWRSRARDADTRHADSDSGLTQRVMHLITVRESSPRITVYELLGTGSSPSAEQTDVAIENEKRDRRKEKATRELLEWKSAAEELRGALEERYPEPTKKTRWKNVVEDEMEEIRRVEASVSKFLTE